MRRRRLARGLTVATVLAVVAGTAFTAVAMANELALRDHPTASSRFGPTTGDGEPPPCDAPVTIGSSARLELHLMADLDGRPIGSVDLAGDRAGTNFRWLAYAALDTGAGPPRRGPDRERGVGSQAVQRVAAERARRRRRRHGRRPGVRDRAGARKSATRPSSTASTSSRAPGPRTAGSRSTAPRSGGRSRRSPGSSATMSWDAGVASSTTGSSSTASSAGSTGSVNGDAGGIRDGALQGTIRVDLSATDRGAAISTSCRRAPDRRGAGVEDEPGPASATASRGSLASSRCSGPTRTG